MNAFLLKKGQNLLARFKFVSKFISEVVRKLNEFTFLLALQLLNQTKRCLLILRHVVVPSLSEFCKLQSLSLFNVDQLLFLCDPHVLQLSLLLGSAELFKLILKQFGLWVVFIFVSPNAQLVDDPKRFTEYSLTSKTEQLSHQARNRHQIWAKVFHTFTFPPPFVTSWSTSWYKIGKRCLVLWAFGRLRTAGCTLWSK